jgi:hypothetical protein
LWTTVPGSNAADIVDGFFESDDWGELELEAPGEAPNDLVGDGVFDVDD